MSDLRGLSKPPGIEVGSNTARFASAFVVAAVAVGAVGYVYVSAHTTHPARQTVAMNETASLPSAAARVTPQIASPTPAVTPNPAPEAATPPSAGRNADATVTKTTHPLRIAHGNSESFATPQTSDTPAGNDSTQPAPALNAAPEQTAPQDSQALPVQSAPAQNPLAPTVPRPVQAPDQSTQNTDQQNSPDQQAPQQAPQQPQ